MRLRARQAGPLPNGVAALILGLVVVAAFAIRVYDLGSFPDTVLADEADNAQSAVRILHGQPPENGFFGLDWTNQPALSAYKEAAFIAVFGFNIVAMRLPSALSSALALIPFYLLLRRQLSVTASILATVLLATGVWYLNFSRSGWNVIDVSFYMLMAMWFLLRGLDAVRTADRPRGSPWIYFTGAGFFCALGLYGYPAGRAIAVAVALFIPVALLFERRHWKRVLVGFALLFVVEAVTFAPQALYIARNWDLFNGRTSVVSIFHSPEYEADPVSTMVAQLKRNIKGPWDGSVNNTPQYTPVGEPQLDKPTGYLVLGGMALSIFLRRFRRRAETWLWWLMLLVAWASTQLLTAGTPNGVRGIGLVPALVFFAGVTLEGILSALKYLAGRTPWHPRAEHVVVVVVIAAVCVAAVANVKHYVDWQSEPRSRAARYLYVTAREFPEWAADIVDRAKNDGASNVVIWRNAHPIRDIANPYGASP